MFEFCLTCCINQRVLIHFSFCSSKTRNQFSQNTPPSKLQLADGSYVPSEFSSIYTIVHSYYKCLSLKSQISKSADNLSSEVNLSDWRHRPYAYVLAMVPYDFGKFLFFPLFYIIPFIIYDLTINFSSPSQFTQCHPPC